MTGVSAGVCLFVCVVGTDSVCRCLQHSNLVSFWNTGCSVECCFGIMYVDWYGISNFIVIFAVEVCVEYGGVYVFHACFDLC